MHCEAPNRCDRPAAEVATHARLGPEAQTLLAPQVAAHEFLALLVKRKLYEDAIQFATFALDKPHAIWWGTLCLWQFHRPQPPAPVETVLQAVIDWLQNPNEEHRRAADAAGKVCGITTPAGCLATAVFFSGGSVSLPDQPNVDPKPHMTARNVANAVRLAAKLTARSAQATFQARCLLLALEIARGELAWQPSQPLPAEVAG